VYIIVQTDTHRRMVHRLCSGIWIYREVASNEPL